jgi:hypothetical protein
MRSLPNGLLLLGLALSACHKYTPINSAAVPVGAEVRAHLTERGLQQLEFVPRRDVWEVDGALLGVNDRDLVLSITLPADPRATSRRNLSQTITLTRDDYVGLDLKEPDHTRSALVVGGIGAVFGAVALAILSGTFDNEEETVPDIPESRVPVWIFRF